MVTGNAGSEDFYSVFFLQFVSSSVDMWNLMHLNAMKVDILEHVRVSRETTT